ncbi:esterase/lipase family protein [Celeribacter neptunius]|uniref:Triacylglycerol esterase/lipase EstA, alpha/beta hydrolase fold n=1 Tax=Celeribacter neptunius TaxID=588602 RepID=A0A1I3IRI5_9RHOB|nr:alpha/beta hydrolase [Celeribacter neptunius]SFI50532.1 Triacylglycerol esterase/lipase EstA, alpha/beta hydrolase fold [Celeribacter neptunius]
MTRFLILFSYIFVLLTMSQPAAAERAATERLATPVEPEDARCVILLHGLARTDASMLVMARALGAVGYRVINQAYPSRDAPVALLADPALRAARAGCAADPAPDVVTHSMGAILLRSFAADHPDLDWGRVVMLGPPNHGSEIVDVFGAYAGFAAANGPAGLQLGTAGLPEALPPVPFEAGVIAGTRSLNPLLSAVVPGEDDGKVSIESTKVAGMQAHLTLPVTHTFMMQNPQVILQTLGFLDHGAFDPDLSAAEALRRLVRLGLEP